MRPLSNFESVFLSIRGLQGKSQIFLVTLVDQRALVSLELITEILIVWCLLISLRRGFQIACRHSFVASVSQLYVKSQPLLHKD